MLVNALWYLAFFMIGGMSGGAAVMAIHAGSSGGRM